MKQAIMGYITGMINNHCRIVESMKNHKFSHQFIQMHENCINELNDLIDFVGDIPEEKALVINLSNNEENEQLRKRINELEESCENMCDIERNLHNQIKALKSCVCMWEKTCAELKNKNEKLEQQVKDLTDVLEGV